LYAPDVRVGELKSVMAAASDSPTRFRGQPWSNWTDFLGRDSPLSK